MSKLLEVENLNIAFDTLRGHVQPVRGMTLELHSGQTIGIVGESGSGKSLTSLALMGLLPSSAQVTASKVTFKNQDLIKISEEDHRQLRGSKMAMIFQDPMTSLNPSFTVGFQIKETIQAHQGGTQEQLQARALELLKLVGIPDPLRCLNSYVYQLSGGMCQRVMIAMAIACDPELLIADEPTTALDVTIQKQILQLIKKIQQDKSMSLMLITHDIGVVAEMADQIVVMYAGEAVEVGPVKDLIHQPKHPYTKALLNCLPAMHEEAPLRSKLPTISGLVPDLIDRPKGCQFSPRCEKAQPNCFEQKPEMTLEDDRQYRCFYPNHEVLS